MPLGLRAAAVALIALVTVTGCGDGETGPGDRRAPGAGALVVAAAADLRFAFEELGEAFADATGATVTFSFGSSGQLREQILHGAPFDLFASANVAFVDTVIEAGRGDPTTKADYAYGRIVVWVPPGTPPPRRVEDLSAPAYRTIAIANPDHAPYGLAARQALERAGIHDQVRGRLVYGANIADALRIAQSGNADAGIVALSLVIGDAADYVLVPEDLHDPLRQALVVTAPPGPRKQLAERFAAFVSSPEGREVMVRHGFVLPDERRVAAP